MEGVRKGDAMTDMELERRRLIPTRGFDECPVRDSTASIDSVAGPIRPVSQAEVAISEFESEEPERRGSDRSGTVRALMANASILMSNREHRLAIHILRNVLMRQPTHRDALMRMGICLRECGSFDEALKCFKALAKATHDLEARVLVAETYYLMERDDMALAAYREVLKSVLKEEGSYFDLFDVYKNIGNIHVRAGDFESAEEFYNKAYILNQNSDVLMVNYGTLEIQRENLSDAVERFRRAVEINNDNDRGWVGLAIVHRQMGDFELAWANVERALDINPNNRTALKLIVEWGAAEFNFSVAMRRLQDYVGDKGGEDAEFCFILAKILAQTGHLRESRVELERVLALDPGMDGAESLKAVLEREIARLEENGTERA